MTHGGQKIWIKQRLVKSNTSYKKMETEICRFFSNTLNPLPSALLARRSEIAHIFTCLLTYSLPYGDARLTPGGPFFSAWPDRSSRVGTVGPCSTGGGRGTTSRPPSSPTPGPGGGPPENCCQPVCVNHGLWCRWVPAMSTHPPTGRARVYMRVSASARLWVCKCVRVWVVGAWVGGCVGVYVSWWVGVRVRA